MSEAAAPPQAARASAGAVTPEGSLGPGPNEWIDLLHRAASETHGLDVIYELLDLVAERFGLDDLTVVVSNESLGPQAFRLGRHAIDPGLAEVVRSGTALLAKPTPVPPGAQRLVLGLVDVALATQLARRRLVRDPATGLLTAPVFNAALRAAAAQSSRYGWTFTVVLLRIAADQRAEAQIRRLGQAFARALRSGDTGGRLFHSTFAALLPNATGPALEALIERFRDEAQLAGESLRYASATAPDDSVDPVELLRLAGSRLHG
jgi:GGDEF domain-containing protein